jgi:hypothetical protein
MNDSIKSHLEEWTNLVYPKKENVYKRKLLVEKCVEYTVRHSETDFTVLGYDLITSGSTIIGISSRAVGGPINYPTHITSSEEFREIFGDV